MARYNPYHDSAPIYAAVAKWKERCLIADGSVFEDGSALWTRNVLDELDRTFVQNLDEGEGDFFDKLQKQLGTGSKSGARLMSEILWMLMLFQSNIRPNKKRENVQQVWAWSGEPLAADHPMLSDAVLEGLGSAGTAYNTQRWREIGYLIGALRDLKGRVPAEREQLLADPWRFDGWLSEQPGARNRQLPHILSHLVFPDTFERISSAGDKQAILAAFSDVPPKEVRKLDSSSIDKKLLEIRQRLEQDRGGDIDFYDDQHRRTWRDEARFWLLSWNPENWNWDTLHDDRSMTLTGQSVVRPWRCASTFPSEGDQVYLVRTRTEPKGIVAAGTVARASYDAPHYDAARASAGETIRYIDVKFSDVREAEQDQIVPLDVLQDRFPGQTWNPQSSGIEITPKAAGLLARLWKETAGQSRRAPPLAAGISTLDKELEDIRKEITREDLLGAIVSLDRGEPNSFGASTVYDVVHDGRRYPPKAVVGLAARRFLRRPLRPDEFSGGQDAWAFRLLQERGFEIVRKEGVLVDAELPAEPPSRVWIEDTNTDEHGHGGPGWEFGTCLWSPSTYAGGSDSYALMREPVADDLVIHVNNQTLVGWSRVAASYHEDHQGPPSPGRWAGRPPYYRIDLKDFRDFARSTTVRDFVAEYGDRIEQELRTDEPKRYPFILYGDQQDVRRAQGAYLTRCTPNLYRLIREATTDEPARLAPSHQERYWTLSLGEGGRLWDECQEKGLAAIGWDEYQLGDLMKYPDRESLQQKLIEHRGSPTPAPINAALCLYQFSHEIAPGDYIIAKAGRRRVLGIGRVTSDYFFNESRQEYHHCRRVDWLSSHGVELPDGMLLSLKTLTDVTRYDGLLNFIKEQYLETRDVVVPGPSTPYSIEDALQSLFMSKELFESIVAALRRKKNVILQGPPGVGKTYAARQIAYALMGEREPSRVEMIQFHQSYAYEDFVQGWRPKPEGGFRLKNGVFVEFCNRARIDGEHKYVFIIDEINRGNLSKILGELMLLIEADKRGARNAIPLTYSESDGERFSVPENVYLLGLMNTADRSLALVDYALRRRFVFFPIPPAFESEKFGAQIIAGGGNLELVNLICSKVGALNDRILADTDLGGGFLIGHSFFCPGPTDAPVSNLWYRQIVDTELMPLVREYWFDKKAGEIEDIARDLRDIGS